jgi:hypothetical protein
VDVETALGSVLPPSLAADLVSEFGNIRQDVAAGRVGGGSAGKFVESVVQALQYLDTASYDQVPRVDQTLRSFESTATKLDDGVRICMPRIARAMYSLRNKRAIVHKGSIDPAAADLALLAAGAQWIMSELLRCATGLSMDDAADLARSVSVPVGGLVEDFGARHLVLTELSTREEILVVLDRAYPSPMTNKAVTESVDRRSPKTVGNTLRKLWADRLVQGDATAGYVLTRSGLAAAGKVLRQHAD